MTGTHILRTAVLVLAATTVPPALPAASSDPASRADLLAIPQVSDEEVICFALYTVHDRILKLTAQLYTLRIKGREFRPMVFREGPYTIHVTSRAGATKTVTGVEPLGPTEERELPIQFD